MTTLEPTELDIPVSVPVAAREWLRGTCDAVDERVAEETPVALVYNGVSHVVMMSTPTDLEDFALGFSLSESILQSADELYDLRLEQTASGIAAHLTISPRRFAALKNRRRNLAGRTGCGLCGVDSLADAVRPARRVPNDGRFRVDAVVRALDMLPSLQVMNGTMRSLHAAAWVKPDGTIETLREDVGRHNAFDKLIGARARRDNPHVSGFALATSRCSYEMAQKATAAGAPMLVTVSAPTALALRLADDAELTVVALGRDNSLRVYTHPSRLQK